VPVVIQDISGLFILPERFKSSCTWFFFYILIPVPARKYGTGIVICGTKNRGVKNGKFATCICENKCEACYFSKWIGITLN